MSADAGGVKKLPEQEMKLAGAMDREFKQCSSGPGLQQFQIA